MNTASGRPDLLLALVDKIPAMVAYWDADLRCVFANRAYEKWFGVKPETMIGRDMAGFLGPLYALNRPYIEGALRGEEQEFEREIPDPAGGPPRYSQAHYVPDIVDGKVRGFYVLVADITRRKRAEETLQERERQLQASERLASMATLAAGIAHEINNPLAAALVNIDLSLENLASPTFDRTFIEQALHDARDSAKRIAAIVESMTLFARGDSTRRELVDVNTVVERSLELVANVVRYRAHLVHDLHEVGGVDGNAVQIAQVLVNLLLNASQALAEDTAATNEIRVTTCTEANDVVIEVSDNGRGIPEELQSLIFDPFFTTKDVGGGMGLGLSISRGIVLSLGGTITVRSAPGKGSMFRVALPRATQTVRATKAEAEARPAPSTVRPRVLVIDDDVALARTLKTALAGDSDVTVVNHGRDALALLLRDPKPEFDVILCDLMMPDITGEDLYGALSRERPELLVRFVLMTGGAFTPRGRTFLESLRTPVLEKPFDVDRVRALVQWMQSSRRRPGAA